MAIAPAVAAEPNRDPGANPAGPNPNSGTVQPAQLAPPNRFLIRPFLGFAMSAVEMGDLSLQQTMYPFLWGVRAGWGRWKLTYSQSFPMPAEERALEPDNVGDGLDLSLSLAVRVRQREMVVNPFFRRYTGVDVFGARNTVGRPDVRFDTAGVSGMYMFNPRFSYDDRFIELEPRDSSSATLFLRTALGRVGFNSQGRALDDRLDETNLGNAARAVESRSLYGSAGLGVAFDWIPVGRLSLAYAMSIGGTFSNNRTLMMDGHTVSSNGFRFGTFSGSGGITWAGEHAHWGFMLLLDRDSFEVAAERALLLRGTALFFLGIRV
jgi:hypothetical protein